MKSGPLSPAIPVPTPTLATQINTATRSQHTVLNKLIIARLPLALPPKQSSPVLYAHGLCAFALVYSTFEDAWADLINSLGDSPDTANYSHESQVQHWLASLRPEGLERSPRLDLDLQHLARCAAFKPSPANARLFERMAEGIKAKPHTLIAYAWVMYMAIFSGGRWIREELSKAGGDFWSQNPNMQMSEKSDRPLEHAGYSFLSFDGTKDGEVMKALFKARLAEAETLLTEMERQDVIDASQQLFEDCISLVGDLDRSVAVSFVRGKWIKILLLVTLGAGFVAFFGLLPHGT